MTNILELVRRNAKLGDPPEPYFNTFPESANVVMKRDADSKASEMSHFCWKMEASVKHQRRLFSLPSVMCSRYATILSWGSFTNSP